MSEQIVYLEGSYVPLSEAKIPLLDHGLLYGDGVFEGIRAYGSQVFLLDAHLKRFFEGAKALYLQLPNSYEEIKEIVLQTCRRNNIVDGYIRLVCTRGADGLGLYPKPTAHPPRLFCIAGQVALYPPEAYQRGLKVITSSLRRNKATIVNPQIKSLNYVNNILASIEANRYGADEALLLNDEGLVTECTGDNVFFVKKGVVYTPPIWLGTLDGITRQSVIALCKELNIELKEEPFTHYNLLNADEAFLTGTAAEIIALTELDGQKIGNGEAGEVTMKLLAAFREYVKRSENGAKI
ncbi:MAG: branched-chain-amino-acid transaminase [Sphaerochaetaceae bacterium]|jgi:branched-chain amino acid aminotransferase